jgi:prepilin-type N-terminal cleavage/methylation domain-containing protein
VVARLRARLAQEDGMTLIELLTTMVILGIVMSGIVAMFVSGLHAQVEMNQRFQAQQNARLALTGIRKDIRGACSATVYTSPGVQAADGVYGPIVTLTYSCSTTPTQVTWCASSSAGSPYGLYRQTGTSYAYNTGTWKTDSLSTNAVFALAPPVTGRRRQLQVTFPVQANLSNSRGNYTLSDVIMLRNGAPA